MKNLKEKIDSLEEKIEKGICCYPYEDANGILIGLGLIAVANSIASLVDALNERGLK